MDTQVPKSCALKFSQCACAVFFSFSSPPELGVHFTVLFPWPQEHLWAGDQQLVQCAR